MDKLAKEIILSAKDLTLSSANEANTRLKVIDRIVFEILGWKRSDVEVEEHVSEDGESTYADYVLRTAMTAIVIEAKKVGQSIAPQSVKTVFYKSLFPKP